MGKVYNFKLLLMLSFFLSVPVFTYRYIILYVREIGAIWYGMSTSTYVRTLWFIRVRIVTLHLYYFGPQPVMYPHVRVRSM